MSVRESITHVHDNIIIGLIFWLMCRVVDRFPDNALQPLLDLTEALRDDRRGGME